jgi:hypothetical protein
VTETTKTEAAPTPTPAPKPAPQQTPTIGRVVHYTLTEDDAKKVNGRRCADKPGGRHWHGAQSHVGNPAKAGDVVAMFVTAVWSATCVNGQAMLDGNDSLWLTSRTLGDGQGEWKWPPRV